MLFSGDPSIVKVFPEPVWPYAKQVTLNYSKAASTNGLTQDIYNSLFD